jgi:hypothetical protein
MPTEIEALQAGTLTDLPSQGTVHKGPIAPSTQLPAYFGEEKQLEGDKKYFGQIQEGEIILPTLEELDGKYKLRRVSAPIPWSVYAIAFVELCERFSYYGVQVLCR